MSRRARVAAGVALAALGLAACGRKGPPVAPETRVPQAVGDLAVVIRASTIELTWTNPTRRLDRTRLRDLALARVFRVDDTGGGEPKAAVLVDDRIAGYTPVATVTFDAPGSALVVGHRVTVIDDRDLRYGRRYTYVVVTADARGRTSPPSRRVSVTYIAAPEPPVNLTVRPGEREARLAWQAPARFVDGTAATGPLAYEVLRATAADAELTPVATAAPGELALTDRGLENERTYAYAVRAVRREGGTTAYSAPSTRVAVTPRKTTPPAPPANLVAIPSEATVRLAWSPSPEPDVAAYVVYRAAARGPFVRVGSTRAPTTVFVDRDVPRGSYRYAVTAQDAASLPNESRHSNEVTVTVP
jgi:fibronectin type 3 domain-containing protein